MRTPSQPSLSKRQAGGITIMVALMMLVFLTITAVGMSRNSFREVVISGTGRQTAMARNVADAGIEWSIYWMDLANSANATGAAVKLNQMQAALLKAPGLAGQSWDVMSASVASPTAYTPGANVTGTLAPVTTPSGTVLTQTYSAGLTAMGKLPITDTSQGVGSGAFAPATGALVLQAPNLWAVRPDAQVSTGGVNFIQAKEVWLSTPVQ